MDPKVPPFVGSTPLNEGQAVWDLHQAVLDTVLMRPLLPPPVPLMTYGRALGIEGISPGGVMDGCVDLTGPAPRIKLRSGLSDSARRFTLAHELGHVALKRYEDQGGDLAGVDIERMCDRLAASMLLPNRWIQPVVNSQWSIASLEEYASLARVSVPTVVNRLSDLGGGTIWLHFKFAGPSRTWLCWSRAGAKGRWRSPLSFDEKTGAQLVSAQGTSFRMRLHVAAGDQLIEVGAECRRRGYDLWVMFDRRQV